MFLAAYRFEGEPTTLLAGHARLLELIPVQDLHLHVCAPHPAGLDVYSPTVQPIGEIASLFLHGKRIV